MSKYIQVLPGSLIVWKSSDKPGDSGEDTIDAEISPNELSDMIRDWKKSKAPETLDQLCDRHEAILRS